MEAFAVGLNDATFPPASSSRAKCFGGVGPPSAEVASLPSHRFFRDQASALCREGTEQEGHGGCGRGGREAGCLQRQSCQGSQVVRDASSFMSHEIKLISPAIYCHAVPSILWELPGVSWQNVILFFFPGRFGFDSLSFNGSVKSPLSILWYLDGRH